VPSSYIPPDVGTGEAGARDLVDPEFEGRRDAEIVHRNAENVLIRCLQFRNQRVGELQLHALLGRPRLRRGKIGTDPRGRNRRNVDKRKVADDYRTARIASFPFFDEMAGEFA
jgi:hypothetical protein